MTPPVPATRDRLRIAIQKSGRLSEPARDLLASCGLTWRESRDRLFCYGESLPIDLLLVRDDDIPGLIADGVCELGIVGRNVVAEHDGERRAAGRPPAYHEWRPLGFGGCRLDVAVPDTWDWQGPDQLEGTRIATSYPHLLGRWLDDQRISAQVVQLSGSVEIAPRLGQADAICDLVSSGATLGANQLKPVLTLLQSEAVVVGPSGPLDDVRGELAELLMRRLDGALQVRESRLLMCRAPRQTLSGLLPLLPEGGPPTITRVDGAAGTGDAGGAAGGAAETDEVAVQVLCHGPVTWQRLEELKRAGASGLLVLPVEGMLA